MEENQAIDLTALSAEELKELLRKEEKARRTNIQLMVGIGLALGAVYSLLVIVQLVTRAEIDWGFLTSQAGLIGCFASVWGLSQKHKQALEQSSQWQDPALAPHLLEVLDTDSKDIRDGCESALIRLLPKVQKEHSELFELNQLKVLMKLAKTNKTDLAACALKALGQVGDKTTPIKLEAFAEQHKGSDPFSQKLAALALQSAGDLRLEQARKIVMARTAESFQNMVPARIDGQEESGEEQDLKESAGSGS